MHHCSPCRPGSARRCLGKALAFALLFAAAGGAVMVLWNAIIAELFIGARAIGYLQALGLLLLCRILFGGFRCGSQRFGGTTGTRWSNLTAEERERLHARNCDSEPPPPRSAA